MILHAGHHRTEQSRWLIKATPRFRVGSPRALSYRKNAVASTPASSIKHALAL